MPINIRPGWATLPCAAKHIGVHPNTLRARAKKDPGTWGPHDKTRAGWPLYEVERLSTAQREKT